VRALKDVEMAKEIDRKTWKPVNDVPLDPEEIREDPWNSYAEVFNSNYLFYQFSIYYIFFSTFIVQLLRRDTDYLWIVINDGLTRTVQGALFHNDCQFRVL
jgi:hypothetical protein